jgi:hypothetical protein
VTSRPPSLVGVLVGAAISTFKLKVEGLREPSYISAPTYLVVWSVPGRPPSRSRLLARVFVLPLYARQRQKKSHGESENYVSHLDRWGWKNTADRGFLCFQ